MEYYEKRVEVKPGGGKKLTLKNWEDVDATGGQWQKSCE